MKIQETTYIESRAFVKESGSTIRIVCGTSILMALICAVILTIQPKAALLAESVGLLSCIIAFQALISIPVYLHIGKLLKKIHSEENEEIERRYRAILKKNKLDEQKLLFFQREEIKDQIRKELDEG